jgi:hypothetical protein
VNRTLTTWLLLGSFLLQAVLWAVPAQRAEAADRLAHEVAHALDQGQHLHDSRGHEVDAALLLDADQPKPVHSHASEGVQLQGLPVAAAPLVLALSRAAPLQGNSLAPPSAHPDGLLRPPRATA